MSSVKTKPRILVAEDMEERVKWLLGVVSETADVFSTTDPEALARQAVKPHCLLVLDFDLHMRVEEGVPCPTKLDKHGREQWVNGRDALRAYLRARDAHAILPPLPPALIWSWNPSGADLLHYDLQRAGAQTVLQQAWRFHWGKHMRRMIQFITAAIAAGNQEPPAPTTPPAPEDDRGAGRAVRLVAEEERQAHRHEGTRPARLPR